MATSSLHRGQSATRARPSSNQPYRGSASIGLLFAVPLISYLVWVLNAQWPPDKTGIMLWLIAITVAAIILLALEVRRNPYSLAAMNWAFIFIFVGVAGSWQVVHDQLMYSSVAATASNVYRALTAVTLWMAFFAVGAALARTIKKGEPRHPDRVPPSHQSTFLVAATILSIAIAAFMLAYGGTAILVSRDASAEALAQDDRVLTQLIAVLRALPVYALALAVSLDINKRRAFIPLLIMACCVVVTNSPFGTARFNVGTVFFGIALLVLPSLARGGRFMIIFLAGFMLLFPSIGLFRRTSIGSIDFEEFADVASERVYGFASGDYDSFTMISYTSQYIADFGPSHGHQLLGPLFFFVPRSIWPDKPIGSGAHVLETYGHQFTNVSSPLIAEALINFGILGPAAMALAIGYFAAKIDRRYWRTSIVAGPAAVGPLRVFYPFLVMLFFFMNRGDLLSTFAFIVAHLAAFTIVLMLMRVTTPQPPESRAFRPMEPTRKHSGLIDTVD